MAAVESKNKMGQGNSGPGIKWNKSVGDYKRGLSQPTTGKVEDHNRKGPGAKQ